eukprot:TRINITY_DN314_c1_g1_i2.p1 TRINITY_DN314_c1_g1~~TRINITY_DN314_c1_g1_i2.p1  ORF type:complete len:104 (-),score=4.32 TRINITY_DN314_c1_g1_i2:551-862(-)
MKGFKMNLLLCRVVTNETWTSMGKSSFEIVNMTRSEMVLLLTKILPMTLKLIKLNTMINWNKGSQSQYATIKPFAVSTGAYNGQRPFTWIHTCYGQFSSMEVV